MVTLKAKVVENKNNTVKKTLRYFFIKIASYVVYNIIAFLWFKVLREVIL